MNKYDILDNTKLYKLYNSDKKYDLVNTNDNYNLVKQNTVNELDKKYDIVSSEEINFEHIDEIIKREPEYAYHIAKIKNFYEDYLISKLVIPIYEGLSQTYQTAIKSSDKINNKAKKNPDVKKQDPLIIFQIFLKEYPNLSTNQIREETNRIRTTSGIADIFDNLVKSVIKANLISCLYNVDTTKKNYLNSNYHNNISIPDFIHSIYIESAKQFYRNPQLFWHKYKSLDEIKNKSQAYDIIEKSIKHGIKSQLPMREILEEFVHKPYKQKNNIVHHIINNNDGIIQKNKTKTSNLTKFYEHQKLKQQLSDNNSPKINLLIESDRKSTDKKSSDKKSSDKKDSDKELLLNFSELIKEKTPASKSILAQIKLQRKRLRHDKKSSDKKVSDRKISDKKSSDRKISDKKSSDKKLSDRKLSDRKISDKNDSIFRRESEIVKKPLIMDF